MTPESRAANSVEDWADLIGDRFEAAWSAGEAPRIEQFLLEVEGSKRDFLLKELLLIEIDLLIGQEENPQQSNYETRFPDDLPLLREVFEQTACAKQAAETALHSDVRLASSQSLSDSDTIAPGSSGLIACGEMIGDFKVQKELGRGGMGVVYQARQQSIDRLVALKMIRQDRILGCSPKQREEILRRFENEAYATANLGHPNIVTVYEVGKIQEQPFFSMYYVRGKSLAEMLSKGPIESHAAAEYLEPIARAIHQAHSQGILHRDLNPRNILVETSADRPLVTDFGLAKLLDSVQEMTIDGAVFGSPPYMAPEQVKDSGNVREAADIYGLGATLYHLITGRPPFQAASQSETMWQVVNEHAPLPRELNPAVERDLETICTKCLAKDPDQRYLSAQDLADDLRRYINNEPIQARPVGHVEQLWRWCLRNQLVASVATIAMTLVTIAFLFAFHGYLQASRALDTAARQRALAEERHEESMRYFRLVCNAIEDSVEQVSSDPRLKSKGLEKLRRSQLEVANRFYEDLVLEKPDDPELLAAQGNAFFQLGHINTILGDFTKAESAHRSSMKIRQNLARDYPQRADWQNHLAASHVGIGHLCMDRGRFEEAQQAYQSGLTIHLQLVKTHRDDPTFQAALAESHNNMGKFYEAKKLLPEAMKSYGQASLILQELCKIHDEIPEYRKTLALTFSHLGRIHGFQQSLQLAEDAFQQGAEIARQLCDRYSANPEYLEAHAICQNNLADIHQRQDRPGKAESALQEATNAFERLVNVHPDVANYKLNLANCYNNLASIFEETGRDDEAVEAFRTALNISKSLADENPEVLVYQNDRALAHLNLGILLNRIGQSQDAKQEYDSACQILESLSKEYPQVPEYRSQLANVLNSLANLDFSEDREKEAEESHLNAKKLREQLVEDFPATAKYQSDLGSTFVNLGFLYAYTERLDKAVKSLQEAVVLYERLANNYPQVSTYRLDLALSQQNLSMVYVDNELFDDAKVAARKAVNTLKQLAEERPEVPSYRSNLANGYFLMATLIPESILTDDLQEAAQLWSDLYEETNASVHLVNHSEACHQLGLHAEMQADHENAVTWHNQAIESREQLIKDRTEDVYAAHKLSESYVRRATVKGELGKHKEALADWEKAIPLVEDDQASEVKLELAKSLALTGIHERAVQLAEEITGKGTEDAAISVQAARVFALASSTILKDDNVASNVAARRSEEFVQRAIELLTEAYQQGYFKTPATQDLLESDPALAPLRDRKDWPEISQRIGKQ